MTNFDGRCIDGFSWRERPLKRGAGRDPKFPSLNAWIAVGFAVVPLASALLSAEAAPIFP